MELYTVVIFDFILLLFKYLLAIMFAPILIRLVLNIIIYFLSIPFNNSNLVIKLIEFLFFPGALFRNLFQISLLKSKGWTTTWLHLGSDQSINLTSPLRGHGGFRVVLKAPSGSDVFTMKDALQIMITSYIAVPFIYLLYYYRDYIIFSLKMIMNDKLAFIIYFWLIISLCIGGLPVPEETLLPLNHFIFSYPHLFIGFIISYFAALLSVPLLGEVIAFTIYFLLISLLIYLALLNTNPNNMDREREVEKYINYLLDNYGTGPETTGLLQPIDDDLP
ncbi:MAG: hypothetical protein OEZ01_02910 [Candidatus Heimdallarchaeota archaeon]|nr:hypothetical protein [Candidatus Heimdallarchaeota archaeon]MDH5644928.1 hypothetical protein [Candidatus Heimdallarchaeota archaeon]